MKSFTDLEQSKKLAEILPLESADMYYHNRVDIPDNFPLPIEWKHSNPLLSQEIPCWSLAALLDVIPKEVKIKGQRYAPCLFPIIDGHWLYKLWYNSNEIIESPIAAWCDNPVDACYKMILELHKNKLI